MTTEQKTAIDALAEIAGDVNVEADTRVRAACAILDNAFRTENTERSE